MAEITAVYTSPKFEQLMAEITEKDVYGQEPIFDYPKDFEAKEQEYKTTTNMKELKQSWTVVRVATLILFAATVSITVAKIVVTYTKFIWSLW